MAITHRNKAKVTRTAKERSSVAPKVESTVQLRALVIARKAARQNAELLRRLA
jgi:hypothetical protein